MGKKMIGNNKKNREQNRKSDNRNIFLEIGEILFSRKGVISVRTILYIGVVILLNIAVNGFSFHLDLTSNKIYSLSEASRKVVSELEEPLTVRVFLSDNLPPPHNTLRKDLSDILDVFSANGKRFFNYSIYTIPMEGGGDSEVEEMAASYGIHPVQIQDITRNEQSLKAAYLGMAVVYGDMIEVIPVIDGQENLELLLTRTITGLTKKSSKFLALDKKVSVEILFSSSLYDAGPGISGYPGDIKNAVNLLNRRDYGIFEYKAIDPEKEDISLFRNQFGIESITFNNLEVYASLVIRYGDDFETVTLLQDSGADWQLLPVDFLTGEIENKTLRLIGAVSEIGYIVGHNNPMLRSDPYGYGGQQPPSLNLFSQTIEQSARIEEVDIRTSTLPEGVGTVIIAGPQTPFSDWELYQIDQFLIRGNSLAIFYDPLLEIMPNQNQMMMGAAPAYLPNPSGLEKLLEHYGLSVEPSYLFDKSCFEQTVPLKGGGYEQYTYYYAPVIEKPSINKNIPWLRGISDIVMIKASPLKVMDGLTVNDRLKILFHSSDEAWTVSEDISLDPATIFPPSADKLSQYPLAAILDGPFTSYYKDKEIPQRPSALKETAEGELNTGDLSKEGSFGDSLGFAKESYDLLPFIESTPEGEKRGQLFLMGCSQTLYDEMSHPQNLPANYLFNTGVINALNGEEDFAVMRNKGQSFNPIYSGSSVLNQLIVLFCTLGIPFSLIILGFVVLFLRLGRRKKIARMFNEFKQPVKEGK